MHIQRDPNSSHRDHEQLNNCTSSHSDCLASNKASEYILIVQLILLGIAQFTSMVHTILLRKNVLLKRERWFVASFITTFVSLVSHYIFKWHDLTFFTRTKPLTSTISWILVAVTIIGIRVRNLLAKTGLQKLMMRYLLVPSEEGEERLSGSTENEEIESRKRPEDRASGALSEKD